jgi:hypothetical protein
MSGYWIAEIAHHMGAVPLMWLGFLHFRGNACDVAWWWLGGAFFVSWVADTASHFVDAWVISATYPLLQVSLVAFVFLSRSDAMRLIVAIGFAGMVDLFWHGVGSQDVLLRTVAWLSVVGIMFPLWQLGRLRTSLFVYFGLGWVTWLIFTTVPEHLTWYLYQASRLVGIALFCIAANHPEPHLRLLRST